MLKRTFIALSFAFLAATAASAQEPGDLSFHKTIAGPVEFIQRTAVLPVPAPPPANAITTKAAGQLSIADQLAVEAALQWQVRHGYLTDADLLAGGWDVNVSGSGITLTFHVAGGGTVVIILSNGPFLPTDMPHRLMAVNVIRISNGF